MIVKNLSDPGNRAKWKTYHEVVTLMNVIHGLEGRRGKHSLMTITRNVSFNTWLQQVHFTPGRGRRSVNRWPHFVHSYHAKLALRALKVVMGDTAQSFPQFPWWLLFIKKSNRPEHTGGRMYGSNANKCIGLDTISPRSQLGAATQPMTKGNVWRIKNVKRVSVKPEKTSWNFFLIFQKYFMKYFRAKNFMKFYITDVLRSSAPHTLSPSSTRPRDVTAKLYVCQWFVRSVCLCKSRPNQLISLKLGVMIGPSNRKNW